MVSTPAQKRLFYDIARGRVPAVRKALAESPELVHSRSTHYFPVQAACLPGRNPELLEVLLAAGGDPNAVASSRFPQRLHTPLRLALDHSPHLVGRLLEAGAVPMEGTVCRTGQRLLPYHRSDLQWAAHNALEWVPTFLKAGLSAHAQGSPWHDPPLIQALAHASRAGWEEKWERFEAALGAVEALAHAVGPAAISQGLTRSGVETFRPKHHPLHMLWALRWVRGLGDQPNRVARVDALLEPFGLPTSWTSSGDCFLVGLALASRGRRVGDGLSEPEWRGHTEHLLGRGFSGLAGLAQGHALRLLQLHLPILGRQTKVSNATERVVETVARAHWWVDTLGVKPGQTDAEGNGLAHLWAKTPGVVWIERLEVAHAMAGLGLDWQAPNHAGETAADLAWQQYYGRTDSLSREEFRAGLLASGLSRPIISSGRPRF